MTSTDKPRHRASTAERPIDAVPTDAVCNKIFTDTPGTLNHNFCPRHNPAAYAEVMARHATDSIDPVDRDPWSGRR